MKGIQWKPRYSDTDQPDKQGRWARLMYYNGQLFAWVHLVKDTNKNTLYEAHDFFPTLANYSPEDVSIHNCFEEAKQAVEERLQWFLDNVINYKDATITNTGLNIPKSGIHKKQGQP